MEKKWSKICHYYYFIFYLVLFINLTINVKYLDYYVKNNQIFAHGVKIN